MTIVPLSDKILVERSEGKGKTPGGILIPDASKEVPARGTVRAIGPGRVDDDGKVIPMVLRVGDEVVFPMYAGNEVEVVPGEKRLLMREVDVLAKIVK